MSDRGVFRRIQEGFRPVQSQDGAVDPIDTTPTPESKGTLIKNEPLATETSTFLDNEKKHESRANIGNYFSIILPIVVVAVFTLAALVICFGIVGSLAHAQASYISSSLISNGGSFTQPQAKILDLIASAIIVPLILALFNYYCFKIARASTVNTESGLLCNLSLRALIEVSTTDWGSYSPFKLFELARIKQTRPILLAIATLASAISFSALSNVVAYEGFTQEAGANFDATLQYLYRKPKGTGDEDTGMSGGSQMPVLSTIEQQAQFSSQWFQVLTALSYSPAGPFLDHGAYIGINVTNASLARLPSGTTNLLAVPAYKLTYDCHPTTANTTSLITMGAADQRLSITVDLNVNSTTTMIYQGSIENGASTILSADNGVYQFLAFQGLFGATTSVMLGNIASFDTSNCTTMTSFGPLPHRAFNNTLSSGTDLGTKSILSVWGTNCTLTRQQGTIDMTRDPNTTAADWKRSPFTALPSPQDKKEPLPLITTDLQVSPQFVSPVGGTIPGLGGALAASSNITATALNATCNPPADDYEDFDTWAQNFLYAEGEARRIAYEIALEEPAPDTDDSHLAYTIVAQSGILRYHMTYLPWILIVGLVALATSGISVLGLEVMTMGRKGVEEEKERRILTPLRVVVDVGAGLERERFEEVEHAGDEGIERWGRGVRMRYVRVGDAGGVRLRAD